MILLLYCFNAFSIEFLLSTLTIIIYYIYLGFYLFLTIDTNIPIFLKNKLKKIWNLMKKGKTSKIAGFKTAKVIYGTVDSFNFRSLYLNIQTWVEPIKDSENWNRVVQNLSRTIKHVVLESLDKTIFDDKFIVDLDLRSSGLTLGKKSFLNLEINLYLKDEGMDFKSNTLRDTLKKMAKDVFQNGFLENKYFTFYLSKRDKVKV